MTSTNLTRTETAARAQALTLTALAVSIDLRGAQDAQTTGFPVTSTLSLDVAPHGAAGTWVDFLGEEVSAVLVDGAAVAVTWDGARVSLPDLTAGHHEVTVRARGRYSTSGQGLHRFRDPVDGATYLYTHFEPSDARRAWPCLEQPDLKAPFTLTVTHPAGWTVLANGVPATTRPASDEPGTGAPAGARAEAGGGVVTEMTTTRPLPSYLTALAAGPWHRVEGSWRADRPGAQEVPLSWSCRASLAEHLDADELLKVTRQGLDLYDAAYAFPYPWGSYDCVLVPEYNIGAMENPGCVTFNEEHYLFQGPATAAQHAGRANTILHEMCHMWFGDLVTPRWWEDTWLKESFADHQGTWAQAQATAWPDAWVTFALRRKAWAYTEDSRPATAHPVLASVEDVEAARQTFDGITYAKGAAVLKQLVATVGQETFLTAARTWFAEHAWDNGELSEFLSTLSSVCGQDMTAWAQAWLGTSGPSVLTCVLEHDGERVTRLDLTQQATDPATGQTALRPHTLVVGLYSFDDAGRLRRTHRLPVSIEGEVEAVPGAVGLPAPDLVTVNDEDLTYAVVRPDPVSLATARTSLARLDDPLAQAVWWSSLSNLVRDGLLEAPAFTQVVLTQATDATPAATLATLLGQARTYALAYATDDAAMVSALAPLAGDQAWEALQGADAASDAQLVRARAWVEAAGQARLLGPQEAATAAARLRVLLAGGLDGLTLDADLRWRVLTALAQLGAADAAELSRELAGDRTSSARTRYLRAVSALPHADLKRAVARRLLEDESLTNDQTDALVGAWAVDAHRDLTQVGEAGTESVSSYLASLEGLWRRRSQELATRVVRGLFPRLGDQAALAQVEAWLDGPGAAGAVPAALRRLVLAGRDDLARALAVRQGRTLTAGRVG